MTDEEITKEGERVALDTQEVVTTGDLNAMSAMYLAGFRRAEWLLGRTVAERKGRPIDLVNGREYAH